MKLKSFALIAIAIMFLLCMAAPAMAADSKTTFLDSGAGAAGFGAAIAIVGAGLGFGKIGAAALESMARQPEVAPRIFTAMLIIGAFLEGATLFALVVCFQLAGK